MERKPFFLLHCLGSEGQEVFGRLPELSSEEVQGLNEYEVYMRKLDLYYLPKVTMVIERCHSGKRVQRCGETVL